MLRSPRLGLEKDNETKTNLSCPILDNEKSGRSDLEHPEVEKSLNRNIWKIRTTNLKARERGVRPVYQVTHRMFSTWLLPSHSVLADSLGPHALNPSRLLCPWDFPDKNIGVGCHFLFQGIFHTQGLNLCLLPLLHFGQILYPLSHLGSPLIRLENVKHW